MLIRILVIVVLLGGSFLAFGFYAGSSPEAKERNQAEAVIDQCKKDMRDDLLPAAVREGARSICNGLRNQYVTKYGREP